MKRVELYAQVRRAVYVEGMSQREAARRFGLDPRTVANRGLVFLFGVQTNQYLRAVDIARPLRRAVIKVAIGWFMSAG